LALKKTYSNTLKEQDTGHFPHGILDQPANLYCVRCRPEPQSLASSSELTFNVALEGLPLFGACEVFPFHPSPDFGKYTQPFFACQSDSPVEGFLSNYGILLHKVIFYS